MLASVQPARRIASKVLGHPATDLVVLLLILSSVTALLVEVALPVDSTRRLNMANIGDALTLLFAMELGLRAWVAPNKKRFVARYWLDILAVVTLTGWLRLLRVLLLLRLFRAGVLVNRRLSVLSGMVRGGFNELSLTVTVSLVVILIGGVTVHMANEAGTIVALDQPGLEGSLWYAVLTLVAGEPIGGEPVSPFGRVVSLVLMLGGLTVFGVFVGAVSASMVAVLGDRMEVNAMDLDELFDHIVVCGWNDAGGAMLSELFGGRRQLPVLIITEGDSLPAMPDGIPLDNVYHLSGDYTQVQVLTRAGLERAHSAILLSDALTPRSNADQDARTVLAALTIERMCDGIFCCAQLHDTQHEELLRMAGVEEIVVGDWYTGLIIGSVGRNEGLVAVLNDILSAKGGNAFTKQKVPRKLVGKTATAAATELRKKRAILIGVQRGSDLTVNPGSDLVLQAEDVLVVIAPA
jgi:voltage-gated potassium channel